jgi:chromosome segregation ATPase
MTTPTKTKKTKTAKPIAHEKATECIALGQLLQDHENSFITIKDAINDHACEIDDIKESIALHSKRLNELQKATKLNETTCEILKKYTGNELSFTDRRIKNLRENVDSGLAALSIVTAIGFAIAIPLSVWAIIH